jgi:hypothetical protein
MPKSIRRRLAAICRKWAAKLRTMANRLDPPIGCDDCTGCAPEAVASLGDTWERLEGEFTFDDEHSLRPPAGR